MIKTVTLKREDCYCDLTNFYENMARKMSLKITNKTRFDCRKICVTKPVQETLWSYYRDEEGKTDEQIAAMCWDMDQKQTWRNAAFWNIVLKWKMDL